MGLIIFDGGGRRFKMWLRTSLRVREWCESLNSKE
jgi:hypothetical protein